MANRQANIRVTLSRGSFKAGVRDMTNTVNRAGKSMGKSLREPMMGAFSEVKKSMGGMFSSLKTNVKMAATLGGAFLTGSMVKGALEAKQGYISLGTQLSQFTDQQISSARAQEAIEIAARRSHTSISEVLTSAQQLAGVTKKLGMKGFEEALVRSSEQAKRLGQDGERVARVYSRFLAKGVAETVEQAELLVEQMNKFGRVTLGIDPDEAIDPNDMGELAAFIKQAGLNADQAFKLMEGGGGDIMKDMGQATEFIEEFGNVLQDTATLGDLRKKLGIRAEDLNTAKGPIENLMAILNKGTKGAVNELIASFGNERNQRMIRDLIGQDLVVDIVKGKKGAKAELQARGAEIAAMLAKKTGDNEGEIARIRKANAEMAATGAAKLQDAMNKMQVAFSSPKMIGAIDKFADIMPKIAEGLVKLLDFAVSHPALAAGLAIGGKGMAAGVSGALGGAVGDAAMGGGKAIMTGVGRKIAWEFASTAAAGGAWKAGGSIFAKMAGPLLGAAIITYLGTIAIDKIFAAKEKGQKKDFALDIGAAMAKTVEEKQAAIAGLKKRQVGLQEGAGVADTIFGDLAFLAGKVTGNEVRSGDEMAADALAKNQASIRELEASIKKQTTSSDTAAGGMEKMATAAEKASKALENIGGTGGAAGKGPKGLGQPGSGSEGAGQTQ